MDILRETALVSWGNCWVVWCLDGAIDVAGLETGYAEIMKGGRSEGDCRSKDEMLVRLLPTDGAKDEG
jgi:hypothetical protein